MKIDISKEWCLQMAQREISGEIGAGVVALDPAIESAPAPARAVVTTKPSEEATFAFSRFVQFGRRSRKLTVEKLAEKADVEISELLMIEEDSHYKPELRTVYQLANFFGVERTNLLQVAGLTAPNDGHLIKEAVRFAARSESVAALTADERKAFDAFVSVLSEKK